MSAAPVAGTTGGGAGGGSGATAPADSAAAAAAPPSTAGSAAAVTSSATAGMSASKDSTAAAGERPEKKKNEIYTYTAPWPIYGMNWSMRADPKMAFRFAVGSFIEEYCNEIRIVTLNEETGDFSSTGRADHPYPPTKIMWYPSKNTAHKDLFATTGDYLRLWEVKEGGTVSVASLLNNNKNTEYCAPLTAFDWNENDPNIIGTASIDTTCSIWDIERKETKTQLIAHDKAVYDIAFGRGQHEFATVGADGSVRMFDLRNLDHSTIMYETTTPLLRLAWNKQDPNYLSTIAMDSPKLVVLDIRMPSVPVAEPQGHTGCINAAAWAPHSSAHICTAGDDSQALIWDLSAIPKAIEEPILAYSAGAEINHLVWSAAQPDWVSITFASKMQVLRV